MANRYPFIRAQDINKAGVIVWEVQGSSEGTTDVTKATALTTNSTGYLSSFCSLYLLGMCRLIASRGGEVHLKGLLQLPEALVNESSYHDRYVKEYLEDAPPGKFAIGQLVYYTGRPAIIKDILATQRYSNAEDHNAVLKYGISMVKQGTFTVDNLTVDEGDLDLLPMNDLRERAISELPGLFSTVRMATLEEEVPETEEEAA